MTTGPDDIGKLVRSGEGPRLECKADLDAGAIASDLCALLNGEGGTILIGVSDSGKVIGVPNAVRAAKALEQNLRLRITPAGSWSLSVVGESGRNLILIDASKGGQKPYLVQGTIFVRQGASTLRATAEHLNALILERIRLEERWERRPALGVRLKDLDLEEIKKAASEIRKTGRARLERPRGPERVLQDLSLLAEGQVTNAGLMLFGRRPASFYRQGVFRVTVFASDKSGSEYVLDEVLDQHLFGTFFRLQEVLQRHVSVSSRFVEGQARREDRPEYPFWALREGILNALVHRDFEVTSGGASLGLYPGRIEIWNSGELPKGLDPVMLKREHPSLPRNPDIAHVCFLRGLIELIGRGTQLIVNACDEAHLKPPKWTTSAIGTRLVFIGARALRDSIERLNHRQRRLLKQLRPGGEITVSGYVQMHEHPAITDRTARNDLADLVRAGVLVARGQGRARSYVRTERKAR